MKSDKVLSISGLVALWEMKALDIEKEEKCLK